MYILEDGVNCGVGMFEVRREQLLQSKILASEE